MRRTTVPAAAFAAALLLGLALAAAAGPAAAQSGDPTDQSSINPETAVRNLEREGYREVQMADRTPFDNELEFLATNPDGERVVVTVDTTTGSKLYETPVQ
jgi:hypothetical protein